MVRHWALHLQARGGSGIVRIGSPIQISAGISSGGGAGAVVKAKRGIPTCASGPHVTCTHRPTMHAGPPRSSSEKISEMEIHGRAETFSRCNFVPRLGVTVKPGHLAAPIQGRTTVPLLVAKQRPPRQTPLVCSPKSQETTRKLCFLSCFCQKWLTRNQTSAPENGCDTIRDLVLFGDLVVEVSRDSVDGTVSYPRSDAKLMRK